MKRATVAVLVVLAVLVVSSCQGKIVKETVVVEKEITKIVKETVEVEKIVEIEVERIVEIEVERIVEVVVTATMTPTATVDIPGTLLKMAKDVEEIRNLQNSSTNAPTNTPGPTNAPESTDTPTNTPGPTNAPESTDTPTDTPTNTPTVTWTDTSTTSTVTSLAGGDFFARGVDEVGDGWARLTEAGNREPCSWSFQFQLEQEGNLEFQFPHCVELRAVGSGIFTFTVKADTAGYATSDTLDTGLAWWPSGANGDYRVTRGISTTTTWVPLTTGPEGIDFPEDGGKIVIEVKLKNGYLAAPLGEIRNKVQPLY